MTDDEQEVENVIKRFIQAIDDLLSGRGMDAMEAVWHHDDFVTSGHPGGDWAHGWDQVKTFWGVLGSLGGSGRGGIEIRRIHVRASGDMAYVASVTKTPASFGGDVITTTNVLERRDGEWKLVHHHADRSSKVVSAQEKLAVQ